MNISLQLQLFYITKDDDTVDNKDEDKDGDDDDDDDDLEDDGLHIGGEDAELAMAGRLLVGLLVLRLLAWGEDY